MNEKKLLQNALTKLKGMTSEEVIARSKERGIVIPDSPSEPTEFVIDLQGAMPDAVNTI